MLKRNVLISMCLILIMSACTSSQTPLQKVANAQTIYNDSLATAISLRQSGVLNDQDAAAVEIVRAQAYLAIQTAKQYAVSGQTASFTAYEPNLSLALDQLLKYVMSKQVPTTQKVGVN